MTKRDYEQIASVISRAHKCSTCSDDGYILLHIAVAFANEFAKDNKRFDRNKFMKACGAQ